MPNENTGIHLKNRHRWDKEFSGYAGFAFSFCLFFTFVGFQNQNFNWTILLWYAVPAGMVVLERLLQRWEPEDCVVLYADRIEFPQLGGKPRVVPWAEVQSIKWPKIKNSERGISLRDTPHGDRQICGTSIVLKSLSSVDRLTLIRYLRMVPRRIRRGLA